MPDSPSVYIVPSGDGDDVTGHLIRQNDDTTADDVEGHIKARFQDTDSDAATDSDTDTDDDVEGHIKAR
jgi:hypothetical protein